MLHALCRFAMPRPYSTLDDWKKICPEETIRRLTVDSGASNPETIDQGRVDELIAGSDGEIEPYLTAAGYDVPLVTVPDLIRRCSCVIGIYNGHVRKVQGEVPKVWRTAYTDVIGTLKDIRDGKMKLPQAPSVDANFACGAVITDHFGGS